MLGTLPLTADGCVAGSGAKVWVAYLNWRDGAGIVESTVSIELSNDEDRLCDSWSTPDGPIPDLNRLKEAEAAGNRAAESARDAKEKL